MHIRLKTILVGLAAWVLSLAAQAGTPYYLHSSAAFGPFYKLMNTTAPSGAGTFGGSSNCPDFEVADFATPQFAGGISIPAGNWTFNLYTYVNPGNAHYQINFHLLDNFGNYSSNLFTTNSPSNPNTGPGSALLSWSVARGAIVVPNNYRIGCWVYIVGESCPTYYQQLDYDDV